MRFKRSIPVFLLVSVLLASCSDTPEITQLTIVPSWTVDLPQELGPVQEGASNDDHILVVADNGSAVLSTDDGELLWSMPDSDLPIAVETRLLYDTVVLGIGPEGYVAWDIRTREELYRYEDAIYDWAAFDDCLIVLGSPGGEALMLALDPETGDGIWQENIHDHFFKLIPEGSGDGYYANAVTLPAAGTQVVLWARSADHPIHGQVRDVSTGQVLSVLDSDTDDGDWQQTSFTSPQRFTEWNEDGDITTYDTATGSQVWEAMVGWVTGPVTDTSLLVGNDDHTRSILDIDTGEIIGSIEAHLNGLHVDNRAVYLTTSSRDTISVVARALNGSGDLWSHPFEVNAPAYPHVLWSGATDTHLVYHYRTYLDNGTTVDKTIAVRLNDGMLLWLEGQSINPLSTQNGTVTATHSHDDNPQGVVSYFKLY